MKSDISKRRTVVVLNGIMIALVFLATYFTRIPTPLPGGYFNLGDAAVMIAAVILGRSSGFVVGAIGSALADLVSGAFIFAPITFLVKGLEGYIVGAVAGIGKEKRYQHKLIILSVILGAVLMVAGYFLAETYILGYFNKDFGLGAALTELLPNLLQGGLSVVIGYIISAVLIRINVNRYI